MTDDDKGIIKMVRRLDDKEVTVIFNGRGASVSMDKYVGRIDEITGEVFDGELAPYRALVLK